MTREEALKVWLPIIDMGVKNMPECKEALQMAIEALEQEPILDKIKAEIDDAKMPKNRMSFFRDGIDCALEIIDKYKSESEAEK